MSDTPLYERIYQSLIEDIASGKLRPGDRVPSEKELAEQFNVSRITSKSALEKLAQTGYIERLRGKGSFVSESLPRHPLQRPDRRPEPEAGRKTSLIGLIAPDVTDSFGLRILRRIEKELTSRGFCMIVKFTYNKQTAEEQAVQALLQAGVRGLVVFPVNGELYNEDLLKLVYNGFPLILVDKYLKGIPASAVYTDNKQAAEELTSDLLDKGHARIAFVSSPAENTSSIDERLQGFIQAHMKRGALINQQLVFTELSHTGLDKDVEADKGKLAAFTAEHPEATAYFAAEYHNAVFLRDILRERDMDDREIVCFDAQHPAAESEFSCILQDEDEIGRQAASLLFRQIEGKETPLHTVVNYSFLRK